MGAVFDNHSSGVAGDKLFKFRKTKSNYER